MTRTGRAPTLSRMPPALVMVAVAVADVAVPALRSNLAPHLPDLLTGLALMWCGGDLLLVASARRTGGLLSAAGIAWFLPDFAVTGIPALDQALAATSLAHVPLLVGALLHTPYGRMRGRVSRIAAGASVVAAFTAVTGGHEVALPATGLLIVVALAMSWHGLGRPRSKSWALFLGAATAYGLALATAPLLRLIGGAEWWLPTVYDVAVCAAAAAVVGAGSWLKPTSAVDVGPGGLAQVEVLLSLASGVSGATVVVRLPEGGWVDLQGLSISPLHLLPINDTTALSTTSLIDPSNRARLDASLQDPLLRECVALAARNARLRAQSAARVEDLARLRQRLVKVEDEERSGLVQRLRAGPLARLDRLSADLSNAGASPDLLLSVERTQEDLQGLVLDLDPLGRFDCLTDALRELTRARVRTTRLNAEPVVVPPACARTLWYACSEALANVTKHAPSATVVVTLAQVADRVVLTVSDDGPGGADVDGLGLRGVCDRVTSMSGTLHVRSDTTGTTLTISVPGEPHTREHVLGSRDLPDAPTRGRLLASCRPGRTETP